MIILRSYCETIYMVDEYNMIGSIVKVARQHEELIILAAVNYRLLDVVASRHAPSPEEVQCLPFSFLSLVPFRGLFELRGLLGLFPCVVLLTRIRASHPRYSRVCRFMLVYLQLEDINERDILSSLLWTGLFSSKVCMSKYFIRRRSFGRIILKDLAHQIERSRT